MTNDNSVSFHFSLWTDSEFNFIWLEQLLLFLLLLLLLLFSLFLDQIICLWFLSYQNIQINKLIEWYPDFPSTWIVVSETYINVWICKILIKTHYRSYHHYVAPKKTTTVKWKKIQKMSPKSNVWSQKSIIFELEMNCSCYLICKKISNNDDLPAAIEKLHWFTMHLKHLLVTLPSNLTTIKREFKKMHKVTQHNLYDFALKDKNWKIQSGWMTTWAMAIVDLDSRRSFERLIVMCSVCIAAA